ncbi:hypothetical protein N9C96_02170 [bacterium]|nr:hypothetical protein [bacterium]
MKRTLSTAALLIGVAVSAQANDFAPAMQNYLDNNIRSWANSEEIIAAILAQNASTSAYDQAMIDDLDTRWRAEVGGTDTPTIAPVLSGDTADFLRQQVQAAGGRITEVFIMDSQGLNVAASAITSDYWQGDEAKFSETYGRGADAVHLGDIEFDESTETYQGQISFTIVDPATGQAIGAMTVGVDAEALM